MSIIQLLLRFQHLILVIAAFQSNSSSHNLCELGNPTHCQCDPLCQFYGDCCLRKPEQIDKLFECQNGRYVINKCPLKFDNKDIKSACETSKIDDGIDNFVNVYSQDNRLFRNAYCAHCNDVYDYSKVNVSFISCVNREVKFKNFEELLLYLSQDECFLEFNYDSSYSRPCYQNAIGDCLTDASSEQTDLCQSSPTWYVFHETGMVFRNEPCCTCNNFVCSNFSTGTNHIMGAVPSYRSYLNFYEWCGNACEASNKIRNFTSPDTNEVESKSLYDSLISYLTFFFSILSLITLMLLLVAYATIKELQNFGGLLTMSLSVSIFMTQLLTLFSEISQKHKGVCKSMACALHLFFLSSFMWMSLFAFDLIKTFYTRSSTPHSIYRKLAKFSSVALGIPAIIIVICLLLDSLAPDSIVSPQYGLKICWFNQMLAGLIWFFIPVATLLLFNVCACLAAFWHLYQTARDTRNIRDPNGPSFSRAMFFLVIKITTLFGIFWLLQLVSVFTGNVVLMDIIGLVNSLQGFLIGVCFLATKRIKKAASNSFSKLTSSNIFRSTAQSTSNTHY